MRTKSHGRLAAGILIAAFAFISPLASLEAAPVKKLALEPNVESSRNPDRKGVRLIVPQAKVKKSKAAAPAADGAQFIASSPSPEGSDLRTLSAAPSLMAASDPTLGPNLIANPSAETPGSSGLPSGWKKGGYGTNVRSLTYPVSPAQSGSAAMKAEITSFTSGDAKWFFDFVSVAPGKTYRFADWYKSNVTTTVTVQFRKADGTFSYKYLATLPASAEFKEFSATFTAPADAAALTVFHLVSSVGWLATDSYSLNEVGGTTTPPAQAPSITSFSANPSAITEGQSSTLSWNVSGATSLSINNGVGAVSPLSSGSVSVTPSATTTYTLTASNSAGTSTARATVNVSPKAVTPPPPPPSDATNYVANPGFEQTGTTGLPTGWTRNKYGTNTASFAYPVTGPDGSKAAKTTITSYTSGDAKWFFAPVKLPAGVYTYSGQYMSDKPTVIDVQLHNANGTYTYKDIAFVPASQGWADVSVDFSVPEGTLDVTVFHVIQSVGSLSIDNVAVRKKSSPTGIFATGAVTFRFDDGWASQYDNAMPALNAAALKGTFYITSRQLADYGFNGFVSKVQIGAIRDAGHEIGAHTRTHVRLSTLSAADLENEVSGSRQDLVSWGFGTVDSMAYPFGDYNAAVIDAAKKAGFSSAAATVDGMVSQTSDKYQLEHFSVENTTTIEQVRKAVDDAAAQKQWLVMTFHRIDSSGDRYSVTPAFFKQVVDYVKAKGLPVVTMSEGAANIK